MAFKEAVAVAAGAALDGTDGIDLFAIERQRSVANRLAFYVLPHTFPQLELDASA